MLLVLLEFPAGCQSDGSAVFSLKLFGPFSVCQIEPPSLLGMSSKIKSRRAQNSLVLLSAFTQVSATVDYLRKKQKTSGRKRYTGPDGRACAVLKKNELVQNKGSGGRIPQTLFVGMLSERSSPLWGRCKVPSGHRPSVFKHPTETTLQSNMAYSDALTMKLRLGYFLCNS